MNEDLEVLEKILDDLLERKISKKEFFEKIKKMIKKSEDDFYKKGVEVGIKEGVRLHIKIVENGESSVPEYVKERLGEIEDKN